MKVWRLESPRAAALPPHLDGWTTFRSHSAQLREGLVGAAEQMSPQQAVVRQRPVPAEPRQAAHQPEIPKIP
jgi:hypothetical protein